MIWPTVRRGDSEPKGSWKTICISLRSGRISLFVSASMRLPT